VARSRLLARPRGYLIIVRFPTEVEACWFAIGIAGNPAWEMVGTQAIRALSWDALPGEREENLQEARDLIAQLGMVQADLLDALVVDCARSSQLDADRFAEALDAHEVGLPSE
jgi:hypothetical protein